MNEWNFVIAAYAVFWTIIIGYTLYLGRTVRKARTMADAASRQGGAR
jgi:CcmD family protein